MGIDKIVSHRYEFEGKCLAEQGACPLLPEENPGSNPGSNPGQSLEQIEIVQEPTQIRHRGYGRGRDHHKHRKGQMRYKRLEKTSILVAIGIFIHNFPEGIATLAGTLKDVQLGILLATAIAIHNIPEGIIVAAPVCAASGNPKKAILWSFLSGVSEPIGALLAGLILLPFINDLLIAGMLAVVAGIMIFISLDELLPMCQRYRYEHLSILGLILGFLVMGISLALI
jgi:zinc transporter ZupT